MEDLLCSDNLCPLIFHILQYRGRGQTWEPTSSGAVFLQFLLPLRFDCDITRHRVYAEGRCESSVLTVIVIADSLRRTFPMHCKQLSIMSAILQV